MTTNKIDSFDFRSPVRESPIRWLILGGVLLIMVIAVGTVTMVGNFRERALDNSKRELENTVLLLARHFDQQFEDLEFVEKDIISHIKSSQIATSDAYKRRMSGLNIHEMLEAKMNALKYVGGINIFDADGKLINSSGVWPIPDVSVGDRPYFRAFKSDPHSPELLVEAVHSRITGVWTTVLAHKVVGPGGEFLGAIGRGVESTGFEKFFASLALGDDAVISMFHRDGTLLARYPHINSMIGQNFKSSQLFQNVLSNADFGTMHLTGHLGGRDQLASARQLSSFPLVITATTTVSAALADWREQIRSLIGVAGLFMLVIVVILILVVRKLSQQHRLSEQELMLQKQRLDVAINNMTQGLLLYDLSERLVVCNQRYIEMYGLPPDVVTSGYSFRDLIAYRKQTGSFKGEVDSFCANVLRNVALGKITHNVVETTDGRSIQIVNQPLLNGGWVTTHEDITERKRAEERITHLAHYDALTDLPNRALFHDYLESKLSGIEPDEQLAVLYIDIDEFKNVNDTLGHLIGDELLKSVAKSLSRCIRATDFVARLGGDEFAIVQTAVRDPGDVVDLVTRIYGAIRAPYECLGHQVSTDASIGIALAPQHGADLDQILKNADLAMYDAKAAGRRTWRFFAPEMDARVKARRVLEMDLRQAILDGALEVHYQPYINLRDNRIAGCEALLRWNHPERGAIPPAEFIPVAEETGLIGQIGEWVLTTACAEAATWPDNIKLAVNVSPAQFKSDTFALKTMGALAASGLSAGRLELEITEAVLIRDDEAALAILHQLRDIGVRIALDDFGTGYSSLSYLQRFPFDKIKIDRCFVTNIAEASTSASIVQAVVNIAAARNITTTAEGVETQAQLDLLRTLGCTEMQGFLFSPAKPGAELKQLFRSRRAQLVAVA